MSSLNEMITDQLGNRVVMGGGGGGEALHHLQIFKDDFNGFSTPRIIFFS
jgi:hypothetical protein